MTVTINGSSGITAPEVILDNTTADGGQVVLKSSGYSNWNLDNYSGRLRAYYNSTEYFTVTNSGNVGIGTSSPRSSTRLDIQKAGNTYVGIRNTTSNVDYYLGADTNEANVYVGSNHPLVFYTNNTERMRIDSSGNLLVGTTSVLGGGSKVNVAQSTASQFAAFFTNTNASGAYGLGISSQTGENIYLYYQGAYKGLVSTSAGGTTYGTASDYRLKENVQPMTGALAKVAQLKPCIYTWKADGVAGQGFIAHELQEVVPECVTGEKDAVDEEGNPKYQGIDTSFLVATLTAAIQEQQAIIESLKTRIETLENK